MRGILGCVVVALTLTCAAGCSRSAPTPGSVPPSPNAVPPGDEEKRQKFESELVHTNALDGGAGSSVFKGTRYDDGKPFTAIDSHATTFKGRTVTLKYEVAFAGQRGGKDVYKLTYTVEKAGGLRRLRERPPTTAAERC